LVLNFSLPGSTRSGEKATKKSFLGRARIRRGLEDDEVARSQVSLNCFGGGDHVGEVGVFGLAQGRGDADVDGVDRVGRAQVGGRRQLAGLDQPRDGFTRDILDVRLAAIDRVHLALVEVDADDRKPRVPELHGQRQTDVAETHDAGAGGAVRQLFEELGGQWVLGGRVRHHALNSLMHGPKTLVLFHRRHGGLGGSFWDPA